MALQTFNWANLPVQDSPLTNLWENAFKGYQMGRAPAQMDEEQKQRQLANKLKEMEVGHKPKEYELSDQQKSLANAMQSAALKNLPEKTRLENLYKQAMINKANRLADPIATDAIKKQQEFDLKRINEIEQLAPHLLQTAQDVAGIQDLVSGNKNPTGLFKNALNKVGLGSKEMGEFNEKALRLQADLARLISSRGGAVAAGLAATGKPSAGASKEYNIGITKSMQERIEREFNQLSKEYEKKSGKKLPYTLEDVFKSAAKQSEQIEQAPQIPSSVTNKQEFKQWLSSLSPEQREAVRLAHVGGQ